MKPVVLIVEDDATSLTRTAGLFEGKADIMVARDGKEAMQALSAELLPSLVILDADLPDISGFDICAHIKNNPRTENIPVIFLSGYADFIFEKRAFNLGCVDYFTKPVVSSRFLMRVNAHLPKDQKFQ